MKKLLIALSTIALTLFAFAATADAGRYVKYIAGYNHCGHPVYAYKYIPTRSYGYSSSRYCRPSYGHSYFRSSGYPSRSYYYRSYSRPSYGYSYSRSRSYCR